MPTTPFESSLAIATSAIRCAGFARSSTKTAERIIGLRAADFLDAEVLVAGDRGDHRQAVKRNAVEAAAVDFPREHGLLAHRLGFAAHDAAAGEDFSRACFDVLAIDRAASHERGDGRPDQCS